MTGAIIVAAGKGTRMGAQVDKLFLPLNGKPLLAHTWRRFDRASCIDHLIIVIRSDTETQVRDLAQRAGFRKPFDLVPGGDQRQDSVWNGLQRLPGNCEIVAIQDAARPCTTETLIGATIDAAREVGASVAAQRVTDTIKESTDGRLIEKTVDRSKLFAVQTPQTFRVEVIRRALEEIRNRKLVVTDDTAACELIGQPVKLVLAASPNPKLTRPEDLPYLEFLLSQSD